MVEEHGKNYRLLFRKKVNLVLVNTHCNAQRKRNNERVTHGEFRADDIMDEVPFCREVMKGNIMGKCSCMALQFVAWYKRLVTDANEGVSGDASKFEEERKSASKKT